MKYFIFAIAFAFLIPGAAFAQKPNLFNTVDGTPLNLDNAKKEGRDTEGVKKFLATGVNIYNENPQSIAAGEKLFTTMCSGCHGHYGEGKIGPGINDDYWTYPRNKTDEGFFSTVYGGATGQMGPMGGILTLDEMLLTMAWVRHLYTGAPETASWLTPEQRKAFKPFKPDKK